MYGRKGRKEEDDATSRERRLGIVQVSMRVRKALMDGYYLTSEVEGELGDG